MSLLSVAEAQARLLALVRPAQPVDVSLIDALGRWTTSDVVARRTQPAVDLSAMDGYALRFAELPGPWRVVGESAAGAGFDRALAPGEAVRIFTGAPVPHGADVILVQEEARREGDMVVLDGGGPPRAGAHIRRMGSDFGEGDVLLSAGSDIGPAAIGLAASAGHGTLPVRRLPRIAVISTGNELVPPGTPASGSQLPSSNAPMLAALVAQALPAEVDDRGIVHDDLDALTAAFRLLDGIDVLVTTGGASVGDHDLVRPALLAAGAEIDFWRVAMKPGKPLMAGRLNGTLILGLPGNPVSAYVTARLFLLPLLRHLSGAPSPLEKRQVHALLGPLSATGGREEYIRAKSTAVGVAPLAGQDSAALAVLAAADALIVRQPHAPAAEPGEMVDIIALA